MKFDLKKALPHVIIIAAYLIITIAYFEPVVLGGKQLRQGDVTNFKGMSKEIVDYRKQFHEEPLWTNRMFGGMPAFQISTLYPGNLLQYIFKILTFGLPHPVYAITLAMLCFYLLLLVLKVDPWVAGLGGLAYGTGSFIYTVIDAGHNPQAIAIALMPSVLAGVIHIFRNRKYLAGAALTGLALGFELFSNHLQMTYYLLFMVLFYVIGEFIALVPENRRKYFFIALSVLLILLLLNTGIPNLHWIIIIGTALYLGIEKVLMLVKRDKNYFHFIKASLCAFIAMGLAIGSNLGNLRSTADYGKYTTRGQSELTIDESGKADTTKKSTGLPIDYATGWSYGLDETFNLMIPNYKGGSSSEPIGNHKSAVDAVQEESHKESIAKSPSYFGAQPFTSGPSYIGSAIVFLFVLGLFIVEGPLKWAMLASTIMSIMLAWGQHYPRLTEFFFDYVPGYNKFRSVNFILVMAGLAIPLLGMLAVDKVLKLKGFFKNKFFNTSLRNVQVFYIALAATGGFALFTWLSPATFNSFFGDEEQAYFDKAAQDPKQAEMVNVYMSELQAAREEIVKSDAIRSFLFIALVAAGLFVYDRNILSKYVVVGSMAVLIGIDMVSVDRRYVNAESFERKQRENDNPFSYEGRPGVADEKILADKTPDFRVFNLEKRLDQDAGTSYFHNSLGGYHGAKLKRYQELMQFHLYRSAQILKQVTEKGNDTIMLSVLARQGVVNMLNTKYIIGAYDQPPIQNPFALGNAWCVNNVHVVPNADSEIVEVGRIDPKVTALVDQRYKDKLPASVQYDPNATIKLTEYKPNHLTYHFNAATDQVVVFSEIYYPSGWNAYVDGVKKDHFCADYVLRAMVVPAKEHKIEFKFEPEYYYKSDKISLASSLLLILGSIGIFVYELRKKPAA